VDQGTFDNMTFIAELPSAKNVKPGIRELGLAELRKKIDDKAFPAWRMPKAVTEVHKRISLAFSCLALVLVGIPLGILARRGDFTAAFGASIAIVFVLYYPLLVMGEVLGNMGAFPPLAAMWTPNVAAAGVGGCLLWRTRRG
jgi:lipopolysaccharide export LptBFGC system permease protein LptF